MGILPEIWTWVVWGNEQLRHVAYYATVITFLGVAYQLYRLWRSSRRVRILVVNADSRARKKERTEIGRVPRRHVTRAEINGLVSQAAGGARLDLSRFRFDYKVRRRIVVELPEESYQLVVGPRSAAAPVPAGTPDPAIVEAAPADVPGG